jgi:tRNA U38,U39,U40 pseudouridine synthase TruA
MRFKLTIEYAGTRYSGWQIQKNARTIQGEIERAVREVTGAREIDDFRSFADADPLETSTKVPLETLAIHEAGDLPIVHVEGSHFLWKMVRRLVGVLVDVGRGGLTPDEAAALLHSRSPLPARLTAPASGLFLERVYYEGDARRVPSRPSPCAIRNRRQAPRPAEADSQTRPARPKDSPYELDPSAL